MGPLKGDRPQPTWEGTDEYRDPKKIPAKEYKERGLKKKSPNKLDPPAKAKTSKHDPYTAEGQRHIQRTKRKKKSRDLERGYTDKTAQAQRKKYRGYGFGPDEVKKQMSKWKESVKPTSYTKVKKSDLVKK